MPATQLKQLRHCVRTESFAYETLKTLRSEADISNRRRDRHFYRIGYSRSRSPRVSSSRVHNENNLVSGCVDETREWSEASIRRRQVGSASVEENSLD